jgi:hypothetical protein
MKDSTKIINSTPLPHEPSITTTDLKSGVGGNYVVNKDWHDPATLTHEEIHTLITQTVERTVEEVVEIIKENYKGAFTDDGGNNCWYVDDLIITLRTELLGKEKDI